MNDTTNIQKYKRLNNVLFEITVTPNNVTTKPLLVYKAVAEMPYINTSELHLN